MNVFVLGINFRHAPIEVREKLSFNVDEQKWFLNDIFKLEGIKECVLLSTCNRTEVYVYTEKSLFDCSEIELFLCNFKKLDLYDFKKYFHTYLGIKAVRHLYEVASGLDSMILGEDQILKQVKDCYELSRKCEASSSVLNSLFREAITVSKKVKTITGLSKNSISVGSVAVKMLADFYSGCLKDKCALVIGAGKIGSIALKNLISMDIGKLFVTNRTHGKAEDISKLYNNVEVVEYESRYSVLNQCDIIISSTSSPHYTITKDMLENSVNSQREKIFVDLAVPRDLDVAIKDIPWVRYFNIDDLIEKTGLNFDMRLLEVPKAKEIIREYADKYEKWYNFRGVLPIVNDVQNYIMQITHKKNELMISRLKSLSTEDKKLIELSVQGMVIEIMDKFIYRVKEFGNKEDIDMYFKCLKEVIK